MKKIEKLYQTCCDSLRNINSYDDYEQINKTTLTIYETIKNNPRLQLYIQEQSRTFYDGSSSIGELQFIISKRTGKHALQLLDLMIHPEIKNQFYTNLLIEEVGIGTIQFRKTTYIDFDKVFLTKPFVKALYDIGKEDPTLKARIYNSFKDKYIFLSLAVSPYKKEDRGIFNTQNEFTVQNDSYSPRHHFELLEKNYKNLNPVPSDFLLTIPDAYDFEFAGWNAKSNLKSLNSIIEEYKLFKQNEPNISPKNKRRAKIL